MSVRIDTVAPALRRKISLAARRRFLLQTTAAAGLGMIGAPACAADAGEVLPEFTATGREDWINSLPLTTAGLRGRPVLIEFWTFGCYNCRNTLPWMQATFTRFAPRGLALVAVHTPEFEAERSPTAVRDAVRRLEIGYPVMLDADSRYWQALGNRYWPSFFLFDRAHRLAATRIGELHAGRRSADAFSMAIGDLLT